ncbi:MAG: DUF4159 domain-containing protein [Cryomorphaceae bacterium]|nr:DUF4159 domain-containing protein [Cryomorphaceae bacterium]
MLKKWIFTFVVLSGFAVHLQAQDLRIAVLKYSGGGDWYANPTSLPNLIAYCNEHINTKIHPDNEVVEPGSPQIFLYPFVHMTGHGNVVFSSEEADNLRAYMLAGGFLHIDDNYGMDKYVRPEIKRIFPDKELVLLDPSHPIFSVVYDFPQGLPKIHEHDGLPPQAFGVFDGDRLMLLYTYESDLGNGWEDPDVHNDPEHIRQKAMRMGANIIQYVFHGAK